MIADWLSEDGRKAIERARLATPDEVDYIIESYALDNDHDRILALLRDRAREWLAERDGEVCLHKKEWYVMWAEPRVSWISEPDGQPRYFADYDAALIAAVNATESK